MGLYKKMHDVMCESEAISKDMNVGFGNNSYKAVSEAAVLNEIKPLLKKHGLVLFPVKIYSEERYDVFSTKNGESSRLMTQVKAVYKIVDVDSGESELLETIGNGVDTQDKASGKALTYGYKCLLQKTFCLFSGEDSDNDHSDKHTANNASKPSPKANNEPTSNAIGLVEEKHTKALYASYKSVNMADDEFKQFMKTTTGKESSKALTIAEFKVLMKLLEDRKNK